METNNIPNPTPATDSTKWTDEQLNRLIKAIRIFDQIEKMTDLELSEAVLHKVWAPMNLGSEGEMLVSQLLNRFEKKAGIERDDEGNVVPSTIETLLTKAGSQTL